MFIMGKIGYPANLKWRTTMPRYKYKCEQCNFEYTEIRDISDPQFMTHHGCGTEYVEVQQ